MASNDDWRELSVSEFAEVIGGTTPSTSISSHFGGDVPWITPKDLSNFQGRYISRGERNITREGVEAAGLQILPKGTVLLSTRAPIGYVAIAANALTTNQGFRNLVVKSGFEPEYVFYLLKQNTDRLKSFASGTTFGELSGSTLKRLRFSIPPLSEQRAIAQVLGSLDDNIDLNHRMNQTLEEICRTLFKFWFVDFGPVRAKAEGRWKKGKSLPGMPVDMWDLWPSEFEESEIGEIPRGWQVVRLSDRFTTQYGYTAAASQEEIGPHLLRVTDINKSHWIDWSSVPYCSISAEELGRYSLCEGDLVVARMADPGKAAIVEGEPSAVFASYLVRLKNDSLARAYYTFYFLGSDSYLEYAEGARSGSVQANMNARVIVDVPYIDPPRPILDAFLDRVLPFRRRITANLLENSTLAIARDALIPKLLSGEIRVKVDS